VGRTMTIQVLLPCPRSECAKTGDRGSGIVVGGEWTPCRLEGLCTLPCNL